VTQSTATPQCTSSGGSIPTGTISLESILCTEELRRRPSRPPDYERENGALVALARALADSPRTILQKLTDTILDVLRSDSAGVSLLTRDAGGERFYWPAISGQWKPHIGGGTPRDFSPCGDVLDRNTPLLFSHVERRYCYFQPVIPPVEEALLVPFYVSGKAGGTIWAVAHTDARKFDAEDQRLLSSLSEFASSAYQVLASLDERERVETALRRSQSRLESLVEKRTAALRHLSSDLMRLQDQERRRISRNLHDSLGQYLASVKMNLESLRPFVPSEQTVHLMDAQESVDKCIVETRTISHLLHPPLLDEAGFMCAARWYVESFANRSSIEAKLQLPETAERLPELTELTLFRILQESLTNVHRHSGSASVEVQLKINNGEAVLTVRDFGRGMPPKLIRGLRSNGIQGGVGLGGMRERVNDLGGKFDIESNTHGTAIVVTLPLAEKARRGVRDVRVSFKDGSAA